MRVVTTSKLPLFFPQLMHFCCVSLCCAFLTLVVLVKSTENTKYKRYLRQRDLRVHALGVLTYPP